MGMVYADITLINADDLTLAKNRKRLAKLQKDKATISTGPSVKAFRGGLPGQGK